MYHWSWHSNKQQKDVQFQRGRHLVKEEEALVDLSLKGHEWPSAIINQKKCEHWNRFKGNNCEMYEREGVVHLGFSTYTEKERYHLHLNWERFCHSFISVNESQFQLVHISGKRRVYVLVLQYFNILMVLQYFSILTVLQYFSILMVLQYFSILMVLQYFNILMVLQYFSILTVLQYFNILMVLQYFNILMVLQYFSILMVLQYFNILMVLHFNILTVNAKSLSRRDYALILQYLNIVNAMTVQEKKEKKKPWCIRPTNSQLNQQWGICCWF